MDREDDKRKKKKKQEKKQEGSVVSVKRPVARQAPPQYKPPPMPVPRMPTNYNLNKQKMEMMRRQIISQNKVRDAQSMKRMMMEKNMEIQRQQQRQAEQRQMANARIAQMNEHNMRVSGGAKRP